MSSSNVDEDAEEEDPGKKDASDRMEEEGAEDESSGGHESRGSKSFDETLLSPVKAAETIQALLKRIDVLETNAAISAVDKINIGGGKPRFEFAKPPKFSGAKTLGCP